MTPPQKASCPALPPYLRGARDKCDQPGASRASGQAHDEVAVPPRTPRLFRCRTTPAGSTNKPCRPSSPLRISQKPMLQVSRLSAINLDIRRGEIFAQLAPNGAGKTTLINIICGIVNPTEGRVLADGHDIITDYRAARSKIGLVPRAPRVDYGPVR